MMSTISIERNTKDVLPARLGIVRAVYQSKVVRSVKDVMRWPDWALGKIPMLCMVGSYLGLSHGCLSTDYLAKLVLFIYAFAASNAVFGFVINDFSDRVSDQAAGKKNVFDKGYGAGFLCLAAALGGMMVSAVPFLHRPHFLTLWALSLALSLAYSLPPIRLKERGWIGWLSVTLTMCAIPALLLSVALGFGFAAESWLFALLYTICGGCMEFGHQRFDSPDDRNSGIETLSVRLGESRSQKAYSALLWLDRLSIGGLAILTLKTSLQCPPIAWLIAGVVLLSYIVALGRTAFREWHQQHVDPYYGERKWDDRIIHTILPYFALPACCLLSAATVTPCWWALLAWFVSWKLLHYVG